MWYKGRQCEKSEKRREGMVEKRESRAKTQVLMVQRDGVEVRKKKKR